MISDSLEKFLTKHGYRLTNLDDVFMLEVTSKRRLIIRISGITFSLLTLLLSFLSPVFFISVTVIILVLTFYTTSGGAPKKVSIDKKNGNIGILQPGVVNKTSVYSKKDVKNIGIDDRSIGSYTSSDLEGTTDYEKSVFLNIKGMRIIIAVFVTRQKETEPELWELVQLLQKQLA